jgi:hypothetical protein
MNKQIDMNDTPETNNERTLKLALEVFTELAKTLKQERDEARESLGEEMKFHHRTHTELIQTQCKILDMQKSQDDLEKKYDNLAAEHMLVVNKICGERDEAREALMKIEDLFIDGTDIYADREKMGTIARAALEGAK